MPDVKTTLQSILPATASPKVMVLRDLGDGTHALQVTAAAGQSGLDDVYASTVRAIDCGTAGAPRPVGFDGGAPDTDFGAAPAYDARTP